MPAPGQPAEGRAPSCGAPKGGGPKTKKKWGGVPKSGGPKGAAPKGGGPKFRAFFPSPATISFLLPSLGGPFVEFGGVVGGDPSNVPVWALGLSCEAPAANLFGPIWPKGVRAWSGIGLERYWPGAVLA